MRWIGGWVEVVVAFKTIWSKEQGRTKYLRVNRIFGYLEENIVISLSRDMIQ